MKRKKYNFNVKSSYVKIIFCVMILFVIMSIALTIALYSIYSQYVNSNSGATNQILFGINTGILTSMLLTMIILGPIALIASRKVASPLVEINKVAAAMSKGDFSVRAKNYDQEEIDQLAITLNQLSDELSNTINTLTIEKNLLTQILNSMSDGLLELDTNQKVNLINKPFYDMFGIKTYNELQEEVCVFINRVSLSAVESKKTETDICKFEDKSILISGSPILSEKNDVVGTVLLVHDVTESVRLEQTRRDYVANVSHELRSPLTAVKGLIIPLTEGMVKDEEKRNHFYKIIFCEIERLNRLVNDLFELSRLQSNYLPFDMQAVDIQKIFYDQQDKFYLLAKEKNIDLIIKEEDSSILANGNIDRISQVLTIFIDNAIKFAKENSTITLSSKIHENRAIISIHNTGSFVKHEDLSYIFDRFYKVDKAHKEEGAGLGLSIAKEVISKMNGNLYVESDGKNETCFSFDLEL